MRRGYIGVFLIMFFSLSAVFIFLSLPDARFYKDAEKSMRGLKIKVYETELIDTDDFISASIISLGVPDTSVGASFDEFAAIRKSREVSRRIQNAVESSGWDFPSSILRDMFAPLSNGEISALIPDLKSQIDIGYVSPNVLVVKGTIGDLRSVWDIVSEYIMSSTGSK